MAEPDRSTFRNYLIFWVGQLASLAGTNIVTFSLTWWITVQTGSAFFLGLSAFFAFGSFILITPIAGVLVDRWSRKKVIIVADSLLAMLSLILVVMFFFGMVNIIFVLVVQLIGGMIGAFHAMAVQAIMPIMVPKDQLSRMNSLQYFATGLIQTVGPVIGALVFTFFLGDMARIMLIDIGTYMAAIIPTILIVIPVVIKKAVEKPSLRKEFGEGLAFIRLRPGLLTLLSMFTENDIFQFNFRIMCSNSVLCKLLLPLSIGILIVQIPPNFSLFCFPLINSTKAKIIASFVFAFRHLATFTSNAQYRF